MTRPDSPLPSASEIVELHRDAVERWHRGGIDHLHSGFLGLVSSQHAQNFLLWHEEDEARSSSATDAQIAQVKRNIDRLNQARNDLIEQLDDSIAECLAESTIDDAGKNQELRTETPGSAIDRLSILSLRLFHYREQLDRPDVDENHLAMVRERLAICASQLEDLTNALQLLLDDLVAGRVRHRTHRQYKMYNDARLNPVLYSTHSNHPTNRGRDPKPD